MKPSKALYFAAVCIVFSSLIACQERQAQVYPIMVGEQTFYVEIADTPAERQTGLMHRNSLPSDRGMLFVFDESDYRSFWMRNTYVNLSIAYLDASGRIIDILDMYALDESSVPSSAPAKYALELNMGSFDRAGAFVGDVIDLSDIPN